MKVAVGSGIGKQNEEKTNIQKQEREGSPSLKCRDCHLNETKEIVPKGE